jgi:RNA polymerase sigma factor (sigma-70 family)
LNSFNFLVGFLSSAASSGQKAMNDAGQLLRRYADTGCEEAFRELVEQHAAMVYSAALRKLAGDTHAARDVAQTVFSDLARKARALPADVVLAGWLYRHTCLKSAQFVRAESRRRMREQIAADMNACQNAGNDMWCDLAPVLENAMQRLPNTDRDALVLLFLQNASLRAIGDAFQVSEDAAQKRISRALDRLRAQPTRHDFSVHNARARTRGLPVRNSEIKY